MTFLGSITNRLFMTACLLTAGYVFERGARRDCGLELEEIPRQSIITNLTSAIIAEIVEATFGIALLMLVGSMLADLGDKWHCRIPFPTGIISWFVLLLILDLLGDLINYWVHRAFHSPYLWPLHRIHHSDEYVNITSATRVHWIEVITFQSIQILPLLFLPITPGILLAFGFFEAVRNYFSHIGAPIQLGRITRNIFVSPAAHRVHHSDEPQHFNKNFSATWIFWDRIFGTYSNPSGFCTTGAGSPDSPLSILQKTFNPRAAWEKEEVSTPLPIDA
jgi:sterol desaturase/sphingolipid hydroxylase (fatty acid hydroxylase superfamily)